MFKVVTNGKDEGTVEEKQRVQTYLETLLPLHPGRQEDDETTSVCCPLRNRGSYLFFFPAFWLADGGVQPVSSKLPLQSLMTDLKDSSLSPLLQITSSDMFGHADNVLSENSFRVGWVTSFQPLGWATSSTAALSLWWEKARGTRRRERDRQIQARPGLRTAQDSEDCEVPYSWNYLGFTEWRRHFCKQVRYLLWFH